MHALTLNVEGIPEGYFPIGDEKTLQEISKKEPHGQNTVVHIYELNGIPEFVNKKAAIANGIKSILKGEQDFTISTQSIVKTAKEIQSSGRQTKNALAKLVAQSVVKRQMPNIQDSMPLIAIGSQTINSAVKAYDTVTGTANALFAHQTTEDFIRNEKGYFVSQKWLNDPKNAKKMGKLKPTKVPEHPKKTARLNNA